MNNPYAADPKDAELAADISRSIHGMGNGLHVNVKAGHVTVSGRVDDYSTERDIMSAVRQTAGVRSVTNYLRVVPVGE